MQKIGSLQKTRRNNFDFETAVMQKIRSDEIKIKPKWLFVAGSIVSTAGLVGFFMVAAFLINLTVFLIRKKGPGYGRLELMLNSFPLWIPLFAVLGMILGIWMLKRYDFSYKKNFLLIIISFVVSIIIAGLLIDNLGLNSVWSRRGPMRRFYQQLDNSENHPAGQRQWSRYRSINHPDNLTN